MGREQSRSPADGEGQKLNGNYGGKYGGNPDRATWWVPDAAYIAAIKAGARTTRAAAWDCANYEERCVMRPDLNPHKRWFEQRAYDRKPISVPAATD